MGSVHGNVIHKVAVSVSILLLIFEGIETGVMHLWYLKNIGIVSEIFDTDKRYRYRKYLVLIKGKKYRYQRYLVPEKKYRYRLKFLSTVTLWTYGMFFGGFDIVNRGQPKLIMALPK